MSAVAVVVLGVGMIVVAPLLARRSVVRSRVGVLTAARARRTADTASEGSVALGGIRLDAELLLLLVASALRSGVPVTRALDVVAGRLPTVQRESLRRVCTALDWGARWGPATANVDVSLVPMLAALAPAWESGASPDGALRLWSEQLRRDRQARARETAARLAVHLVVPLGLCFLPAFVLLGLVPLVVSFGSLG